MKTTVIFGTQTEQCDLETLPAIGATVAGPDGQAWRVVGVVTRPDGATLTCRPADAPNMLIADGVYPLQS